MANHSSGIDANTVNPPAERAGDAGVDRRAAIQAWTGKAIEGRIHSRSLDAVYRRWLFQKATRQPCLCDMCAEMSIFDQTLLNLRIGNDHLVVAQSESYIARLGRDLRGTLASELKFATANSLRDIFDESLAQNQPFYVRYISSLSTRNVYWEAVILPLSAHHKAKPLFTLSCLGILSEKTDMLQILYDRAPVGIVAAVPIMDGRQKSDDARILTMNPKAREILRQPDDKGLPNTVGEMVRYLSTGLGRTAHGSTTRHHTTDIEYISADGERFSLTIELIDNFILMTIAPKIIGATPAGNRFARLLGLF